MNFINPYIAKIQNNHHIIQEKEISHSYKGKWHKYFSNKNALHLEIGTGLGNFFSSQVKKFPEKNFIGLEIKFKRVYKTYEKSLQTGGNNFVILKRKGQEIDEIFGENEIETSYIFFPDPWDKKDYQQKNKLLQKDFLKKLFFITKVGGNFIFKTDHRDYFDEVVRSIKEIGDWHITRSSYDYEKDIDNFDKKNLTEFEALFRGERKQICYLECSKL